MRLALYHFLPAILPAAFALTAAEAPKTIGDPYGVTTGLVGWRTPTAEKELALMEEQGIGNVRFGAHWNETQSPHKVWVWKNYDLALPLLKKSKVKGMMHFGGSVPAKGVLKVEDIPGFLDFIERVMTRHPGVADSYEILNETDLAGTSAEDFAAIFKASAEKVRQLHPGAPIVYGGNSGVPLGYIEAAFKAGAADAMDVMSCHPYPWGCTPEISLRTHMRDLRALMKKYNAGDKPIWITEIGYSSEPPTDFVQKVFPQLFKEMGLKPENTRVIAIHDPEYGYYSLTHSSPLKEWMPQIKSFKYITLQELKALKPYPNDLLLMSDIGCWPSAFNDALVDYFKKGGKVLSPGAIPFYCDLIKEKDGFVRERQINKKNIALFHLGWDAFWTNKNVPPAPKAWEWAPGYEGNELPVFHTTHYFFNGDNLAKGDRFVPVLYGTTPEYKGVSAGVYHFNSDLKGKFAVSGLSWRGCSEEYQAYFMPRMFFMLLSEGVEKVFIHHYCATENANAGIEGYFGIRRRNTDPKPASDAYGALTHQMPPGSTVPKLSKKGDCWRASWVRPDGAKGAAFWRESTRTENVTFRIQGPCVVTDCFGKEIQNLPTGGTVTLPIGPGAVYFQYRGYLERN